MSYGKGGSLEKLSLDAAKRRASIVEEAWDYVAGFVALPKNKSQRDLWTRLMRNRIRQRASMYDLGLFPQGPFEYVKQIVDEGIFMNRKGGDIGSKAVDGASSFR